MAFCNGHHHVPCHKTGIRAPDLWLKSCVDAGKLPRLFQVCSFVLFCVGVLFLFFNKVKISSKCPHMRADAIMHVEARN